MLIGLWKRSHSSGLRTYLICSVTFLFLLAPLTSWLGRGTLQRLIALGTLVPVGVVGFFFWRELHRGSVLAKDMKEYSPDSAWQKTEEQEETAAESKASGKK